MPKCEYASVTKEAIEETYKEGLTARIVCKDGIICEKWGIRVLRSHTDDRKAGGESVEVVAGHDKPVQTFTRWAGCHFVEEGGHNFSIIGMQCRSRSQVIEVALKIYDFTGCYKQARHRSVWDQSRFHRTPAP